MKFMIDRNSLMNLERYYPFDKQHNKTEYEKFRTFFKNKFKNKEIIIIDKVDNEGIKMIKKEFEIDNRVITNTENILDTLNEISNNEKNININHNLNSEAEIERTKEDERENKVDLSLIAYCVYLKRQKKLINEEVILITDETKNEKYNTKLYKKIPNICKNYSIECKNLPYLIFEFFRDEIQFKINLNQK